MPSDAKLAAMRRTTYASLSDVEAARTIANLHGLSFDSVRGRLSRVKGVDVLKELSQGVREVDPSVYRQEQVIARAEEDWAAFRRPAVTRKSAFISDLHFPYARFDAIELLLRVLEDFRPDVVTVDNDLSDNNGYSTHWDDPRSPREKLWSSDVANARAVEQQWYSELGSALNISVQGNHDIWWWAFLRERAGGTAEQVIADYMEWRERQGVLQFSRGVPGQAENAVRLSENLIYWHGQYVNQNPVLRGKKTIQQFMADGQASTVVVGHTHRPAWVPGEVMGYHGVNFYNAPCLSRVEAVPYSKRDPREWRLGMVLHEYRQGSRQERGHLIVFEEFRGKLLAQFAGKEYSVAVDKGQPRG